MVNISHGLVELKKIFVILLLCSITSCQLFSKPAVIDSENENSTKQLSISTKDYPPLLLTLDPDPGSTIKLRQKFILEFSQVMDKKSVEAAFQLDPLVAGSFEWLDGKSMTFIPDQELPVGQNISLELNTKASNISGALLGKEINANYRVAQPLRVGNKYPDSGEEDVDTNTHRIYLTFNQPVVNKINDVANLPVAFRIIPDQPGYGQWINNSTYMYFLEHGLSGGTDFQLEINRNLKSVNGTILEISSNSNWQFKTIEPDILQYSPSINSTIPLDQKFNLIFNQSMQTETIASNFLFHDVSGQPVSGRFYWNDIGTEMTFIPDKILKRGTTYLMELLPGSQVKGGNVFEKQLSVSYTTIQDFILESTIPANQQPINMVNGKSSIFLIFSSELDLSADISNFISVYPEVLDLEITPGDLKNELEIKGTMEPGQTYKVLISNSLKDRWGSFLAEPILNEYIISPPEPAIKFQNIVGNNVILVSNIKPVIHADVTNFDRLTLILSKLEFSEFAALNSGETFQLNENRQAIRQINTNAIPNRMKSIELDLEIFNFNLSPGIYCLDVEAENDYENQFFIIIQHNNIFSKISDKQLLIWSPYSNSLPSIDDQLITIYDDSFQEIITAVSDPDGVKLIDPFLYGHENSNFWIEYGTTGDQNYSLYYSGWNLNKDGLGFDQKPLVMESDIEGFFISDQNIYRPGDVIHFYAVIRSIVNHEYLIPNNKDYQFYLRKINSDFTIENEEITLSDVGTLNGKLQISENLTEGLYEIGLNPNLLLKKQIYIEKRHLNDFNFSINFNADRYKIGSDISLLVETLSPNINETVGIPIKWSIEFDPIVDISGIHDDFKSDTISQQNNQLLEGIGNLGNDGRYLLEIDGSEIANLLPSNDKPFHLSAKVEIFSNEFLPYTIYRDCIIYPESYLIEIETNPFYLDNPEIIPIQIYSKNWDQKMIGAIDINILMQKAITGDSNNEFDVWGDLYKAKLRTNGSGNAEYEAFINGPGIYKLTVQSGKLKIVRLIFVGGQGKTQYPIESDGNLPIVLEKTNYSIGETAEIFIPNPFNNPAILLLTLERDHVLFQEVIEIKESFFIYKLPIIEDHSPNIFISILMIDENNANQISGIAQIDINSEHNQLSIDVEIDENIDIVENPGIIDFVVKDSNGTPVQAELYIQASKLDFLPNSSEINFEKIYHHRPDLVLNNYISSNDAEIDDLNNRILNTYQKSSNNISNQTHWVRKIMTDENGHATIDVLFPLESDNHWLQVIAISKDLKIGNTFTRLPPGFTTLISTHIPQFVNRGDEFILGLELTNLLEFPQTINIVMENQDLQVIDDLTKQINLGVGETKKVSWQVLAFKHGLETIIFQVKNPAGKTIAITQDIHVEQLPEFSHSEINGSSSKSGEDNYYFGIVNNNSYVDGDITTYIIPNLSSSLIAGIENLDLESLTVEQKAWTLLGFLHVQQLIQVSADVENTLKENLFNQTQELVQSLILTQNEDGGWSKVFENESDPKTTAICSWALKLSEIINDETSGENLNLAMEYMLNNIGSPDSLEDTSKYDQLAVLYFGVKYLDNEKVNPTILLPYLEYFSTEGKIFLSMALELDDRGNEQSRTIIKEIEKKVSIVNNVYSDENDRLLIERVNTSISRAALLIYAVSIIDPANTVLVDAIPYIMGAQKTPGQWNNVVESGLSLMAISKYIMGTGTISGNYEFQAFLNEFEIMKGSGSSINYLAPIKSQIEINQNDADEIYNLKFKRSEGPGTLFYMTQVSINKLPNQISSQNSGFTIQRYFFLDENINDIADCFNGLCFGDNLTVHTNNDQPIQVLLVITTPNDKLNVSIEEHLPAGMTLLENSLQDNFYSSNFYQPIIDLSKEVIQFQSQSINEIKWFAEELPAGTYVVSYLLEPSYIGQFSIAPAKIWSRYESNNPSWSKGQLITIISD